MVEIHNCLRNCKRCEVFKVHWVIIWEGRKLVVSQETCQYGQAGVGVTFKARLYRSWPVFIFIRKESHELFENDVF